MTKRKDSKGRVLKEGETQRKDGRYQYRYTVNGKRYTIYGNTLPELREKEKQVQADIRDGVDMNGKNLTLNEVFALYMSGKKELKQSTRTNYNYMYKKFVQEEIGERKIISFKYSDMIRFYQFLIEKKGFQPDSVKNIHTILHPVFTLAVRDGYIRNNPTDRIMGEIKKSYTKEKTKRHALTIQEQEQFISFCANSNIYRHWLPLFTFFLGTGCRVGEVIGLRWEDCDFEQGTISINHNLVYRLQENGKNEFYITTPKTNAGVRIIPMMQEVRKALLQERKRQMSEGFCKVEIDGYTNFVFINKVGNVHCPTIINRAIKKMICASNKKEIELAEKEQREPILIRDFSVHSLRHTFCTRFCENETNIKVIQEIMGHSDISTTMNIYAEATKEIKVASIANLEGKFRIS